MTTFAALFAAVPLMLGFGEGSELRRPLGVAIFGGLIVSQLLTLVHHAGDLPRVRPTRQALCATGGRARREQPVMNLSAPFVHRPVGTTLLAAWLLLAGIGAFFVLPVSPLPQVDFPTVSVTASLPGASPETMASSVATPLERRLGIIADVNEMTSSSSLGQTQITLQFNLDRDIDGAARDVQAAINAARADLPATLQTNPTYRKVNPAEAPIMILALTSKTRTPGQIYDAVSNIVQQRLVAGERRRRCGARWRLAAGGARGDRAVRARALRHQPRRRAHGAQLSQSQPPQGRDRERHAALSALHQRQWAQRPRITAVW